MLATGFIFDVFSHLHIFYTCFSIALFFLLFSMSRQTLEERWKQKTRWTIAQYSRDIQVKNIENVVDIALKMRQFERLCCVVKRIWELTVLISFSWWCLSKCDIVWETNWKEWCEKSELANENPLPKCLKPGLSTRLSLSVVQRERARGKDGRHINTKEDFEKLLTRDGNVFVHRICTLI